MLTFGGSQNQTAEDCIGLGGENYVNQSNLVEWDFVVSVSLTRHFLLNRFGDNL